MQEKVVSRRELNKRYGYKSKAPLKIDRFIGWISKLILQLLIFTILYTVYIDGIREKYNNFFIEFGFICLWLITSDFLALTGALIIRVIFNYKMDYLPSEKKKGKNYNRLFYQYLFYTIFRCVSYILGLTPLLTSLFYNLMPFFWGFFAYFLAWFLIFIGSKLIATGISIGITKSI